MACLWGDGFGVVSWAESLICCWFGKAVERLERTIAKPCSWGLERCQKLVSGPENRWDGKSSPQNIQNLALRPCIGLPIEVSCGLGRALEAEQKHPKLLEAQATPKPSQTISNYAQNQNKKLLGPSAVAPGDPQKRSPKQLLGGPSSSSTKHAQHNHGSVESGVALDSDCNLIVLFYIN